MKSILILRGGALGDFIVTLPLLSALRKQWPDAVLRLAARPAYGRLALDLGLALEIIPLESARMSAWFCDKPVFSKEEMRFIRSLDVVVSFLADKDGVVQDNMNRLGLRQWLEIKSDFKAGHVSAHFLNIAAGAGLILEKHAQAMPFFEIAPELKESGRLRLEQLTQSSGPWAFLHPGSGSHSKNWPLSGFLGAARELAEDFKLQPVFLAGEADEALVGEYRKGNRPYPIVENTELSDLAGLISLGSLYLGNDSGVSHLAAALGVCCVAIFGPTDPERWAPRGPCARVVRSVPATAHGLARLPLKEVVKQVKIALSFAC